MKVPEGTGRRGITLAEARSHAEAVEWKPGSGGGVKKKSKKNKKEKKDY